MGLLGAIGGIAKTVTGPVSNVVNGAGGGAARSKGGGTDENGKPKATLQSNVQAILSQNGLGGTNVNPADSLGGYKPPKQPDDSGYWSSLGYDA